MRLVIVALLALASPARAEPDPTTATVLSASGTVLPVAGFASISSLPKRAKWPMFVGSVAVLLVAPSAGQFYAGESLSTGFKVRIVGVSIMALGGAIALGSRNGKITDEVVGGVLGALIASGGLLTMGIGALHDVATAGTAVRERGTRMFTIGSRF